MVSRRLRFILISLLITSSHCSPIFQTLDQVTKYARSTIEYPPTDNQDWLNPDYTTFHKEQVPTIFQNIMAKLGITTSHWSHADFKNLLQRQLSYRELHGFYGQFIERIAPKPGSQFYIWGDVHGAFHSLVRDLQELHKKGVINQNLTIQSPNVFFVFNGNVVDQSAYILETLTLVMRLMEKNPNNVLYIKGEHESKQKWQSYGLARELKIHFKATIEGGIPLNEELTKYFNTLPLAVYLQPLTNQNEKEIDVVRISYFGRDFPELDEAQFSGFFTQEIIPGKRQLFSLKNKKVSDEKIVVRAMVRGEDRTTKYKRTQGLVQLDAEKETLVWSIFSSPIGAHRRLYGFFYDAFGVIDIHPSIQEWTISLFNQDVREFYGFRLAGTYNLLSGQVLTEVPGLGKVSPRSLVQELKDTVKGIDKDVDEIKDILQQVQQKIQAYEPKEKVEVKEVAKKTEPVKEKPSKPIEIDVTKECSIKKELKLGSLMDLSKRIQGMGNAILNGLKLGFVQVDKKCGINGVLPELIVGDDEYNPEKSKELLTGFIKEGIDILISPNGSPTLNNILPQIKEHNILVLFPVTGAPDFRAKDLPTILHWRAPYNFEARVLAAYGVQNVHIRKPVLFYQNDEFGNGLVQGAETLFKQVGLKNWKKVSYDRGSTSFSEQAKEIMDLNPDAIFFFATIDASRDVIKELGADYLKNIKLFGNSDLGLNEFTKFIEDIGLMVIIANVVPNPHASDLEIVQEYRQAAKKYKIPIDPFTLEAYISTQITFELMKLIKTDISKDAILAQAKQVKDFAFKGLTLNYNPQTNALMHTLWLNTGKKDWVSIHTIAVE